MLHTGDILLFNESPTCNCMHFLDNCIKCCTNQPYSHSALVVVNPPWKDDDQKPIPPGTYVWESSYHGKQWPDKTTHTIAFGVQLQPIQLYTKSYPGHVKIYVRRAKQYTQNVFQNNTQLTHINRMTKDKPYDIHVCDWIAALFKCRSYPREAKRFFCSAFVAYVLTQMKLVNVDWTIISPALLSSNEPNTIIQLDQYYEPDELYRFM